MSKMLTCFCPFCGVTDVAFIRVVSVRLKSSKPHEEVNGMDRNWDQVTRLGPDTWRWWHVTEQVQQRGSEDPSWEWARRLSSRRFHEEELGTSPQFSSAKRGWGCWGSPWFEDLWTSPCHFIALIKTLTAHFIQSNLISLVCLFFIPTPISLMPKQPPT